MPIDLGAISRRFGAENTSAGNFGSQLTAKTTALGSLQNAAAQLQNDVFMSATEEGAGININETIGILARVNAALAMIKDFLSALVQRQKDDMKLMASMNDLARPASA